MDGQELERLQQIMYDEMIKCATHTRDFNHE